MDFIQGLSKSIERKSNTFPCNVTPVIERCCTVLNKLSQWIDEIPPIKQPMRYGNKAYRIWHERLEQHAVELMKEILPEELHPAAEELAEYFKESFGDKTRIDYGTGHETTFVAWLCCLELIGATNKEDRIALVLKVFLTYLTLMRKLQRTYYLEPAGSHGVWSLDDYQHLPFYFGAAQLFDHPVLTPKSVRNKRDVEEFASEFMYFGCIKFILEVKSGLFAENSPMLDSIADVPHWQKVNEGMWKMYKAEVLGKFPVMQHFLFGSILKWNPPEQLTAVAPHSPSQSKHQHSVQRK